VIRRICLAITLCFTISASAQTPDFPDYEVNTGSTSTYLLHKGIRHIFSPLAIMEYATQRSLMFHVYPAQTASGKRKFGQAKAIESALRASGQMAAIDPHYRLQEVKLTKNGVSLSGWIIYDPAAKNSGKWILQASGNCSAVEQLIPAIGKKYIDAGFNTLLVNNPGVGKSDGISTPQTIGETQQLALSYLEDTIGANKIVLAGHSLGGAAIGQAILQHPFNKPHIQYLVVQQMTFAKLSRLAGKLYPFFKHITAPLFWLAGIEMDTLAASRKLETLGITEHVLNKRAQLETGPCLYAHDKVIPEDETLAHYLHCHRLSFRKFINHPVDFDHSEKEYLYLTARIVQEWDLESVD